MVQASDEVVSHDLPEAMKLMQEMGQSFRQVSQLVDNMLERVKRGEVSTAKGLSFLEVKYHMLLSYLINLTYVILRKCSGDKIEGDPTIERLVEIRTVMEKMRPMESKLKYQIDKLVKTAVSGKIDPSDPLRFRPRPGNFTEASSEEEDDSDEGVEGEGGAKSKDKAGIYVPPRIRPMHFDLEESRADKEQQQVERARRRALGSAFLQDLREEYLDAPVEEEATMLNAASSSAFRGRTQASHKKEYEEDFFTRLPTTRVERHAIRKNLTTVGMLGDEVTRFGDGGMSKVFEGLEGNSSTSRAPPSGSKKRKKLKGNTKGKKKGAKKRRFH